MKKDMPNEVQRYLKNIGGSWEVIDTRYDGEKDCPLDEQWERWEIVSYSFLKGSIIVKTFYIDNWCGGRRVSESSHEMWVGDMKRWLAKASKVVA